MKEEQEFEEWFNTTFLFSRDPACMVLNSDSRTMRAKNARICEVCKRMIRNPSQPTQELREEIAIDFLISMRCALDYLSYSKLILKKWEEFKKKTSNGENAKAKRAV